MQSSNVVATHLQDCIREAYVACSEGDAAKALRIVLTLVQATGGRSEMAAAFNRVLEQLTAGDSSNAVQELTELFSRAAIAPGPQQPAAGVAAQLHHHHQQQQPCSSDNTMSCSDTSGDPQQHLQGSQGHSYPHPQEQQPWGLQGGSTAAAAAAGGGPSGSAWGGGPSGSGAQGEEATSPWHGPTGTQRHAPILCETGREGFMQCALDDGSSYACPRCGGVVLASRRQQHDAYWCPRGAGGAAAGRGQGQGARGAGAGQGQGAGVDDMDSS